MNLTDSSGQGRSPQNWRITLPPTKVTNPLTNDHRKPRILRSLYKHLAGFKVLSSGGEKLIIITDDFWP
jgi:hypothetical protein